MTNPRPISPAALPCISRKTPAPRGIHLCCPTHHGCGGLPDRLDGRGEPLLVRGLVGGTVTPKRSRTAAALSDALGAAPTPSHRDALHDLVGGARDALSVAGTGASLAADDRLIFATAHPEAITVLERVQERHQSGPCVEAHRTGQRVVVPDIAAEWERWPQLVDAAEQVGIRSAAGIPIRLNGTSLGALNLYDDTPRDWADEDLRVAEVLAAMAAGLVANAHRLDQARTTAEQLQRALDSRVVIEQAKGIIAAEAGIPIDDAFDRLRTHARSHNLPLRSVAEAVVHLRLKL